MRVAVAAALLVISCSALAEPVVVLGLPLGGKIKVEPKCRAAGLSVQAPCWVEKPAGSTSGAVNLPAPETRPVWAAYGSFYLDLASAEGVLNRIKVNVVGEHSYLDIRGSINQRFGKPTSDVKFAADGWASEWNASGVYVQLMCAAGKCVVEFETPQYHRDKVARMGAAGKAHPLKP